VQPVGEQQEVLRDAHLDERALVVVHGMAVHLEAVGDLGIVEPHHVAVGLAREQHARLLEALADRGHQPGEPAGLEAEQRRGGPVVVAVADRLEVGGVVGVVDPATGKTNWPLANAALWVRWSMNTSGPDAPERNSITVAAGRIGTSSAS
jgi:hypothetical protein